MSQTVYYSPWNDSAALRAAMLLAFQPPVSVLTDMTKKIQRENNRDNFINCPAFINSIKNTFLLSSPTNCAVEVHGNTIIDTAAEKQMLGYLTPTLKAPSMLSSYTINLGTNWIFFSEHDQEIGGAVDILPEQMADLPAKGRSQNDGQKSPHLEIPVSFREIFPIENLGQDPVFGGAKKALWDAIKKRERAITKRFPVLNAKRLKTMIRTSAILVITMMFLFLKRSAKNPA